MIVLFVFVIIYLLVLGFVSYILEWTMKQDAAELGIDYKEYIKPIKLYIRKEV